MPRAQASVARSRSSPGITRFTKPSWRASSAGMKRLSNKSSLALRKPTSNGVEKYST
jgi:hypothetical protein